MALRYLDQDNLHRRMLCSMYDDKLRDRGKIEIISHSKHINSSRHLYQISVVGRDDLMEKLSKLGIYCGVHYSANHKYSIYKGFKSDVTIANKYSATVMSLPLHLGLDQNDVEYICNAILS